tara:strand:- start:111 stop:755 length:645 start_codon:yes stop_codon:yes gene_type:complete
MENKDIAALSASMEEIVNSLPDIISSKVILDENETIIELHILSNNNRNPKQISRDVQSALAAKFGISVDHKKVSIAQVAFNESPINSFRLLIDSINYSTIGNIAEITVKLRKGDEVYEGIARGANSTMNTYRLIASATLDCIHKLLNVSNAFVVEDIERITLAKQDVMTIAISFITTYQEELLVGSAIIRKNEKESIVKATLDAINRRIVTFNN